MLCLAPSRGVGCVQETQTPAVVVVIGHVQGAPGVRLGGAAQGVLSILMSSVSVDGYLFLRGALRP